MVDLILVVGATEQLELQPLARDRGGSGRAELSHRRQCRDRYRVARRARPRSGLTAGASAPEVLVDEVVEALRPVSGRSRSRRCPGMEEKVYFRLPRDSSGLNRARPRGGRRSSRGIAVGIPLRQHGESAPMCSASICAAGERYPLVLDARAAVPLQSRLRRLRQDRLSRQDSQSAPLGRRLPRSDRRMRRAGRRARRRRAAACTRSCRRS